MTEHDYTDDEDGVSGAPLPGAGRTLGVLSMLTGAVLCVAVVLGAGYWAMGLDDRRAADLPVFRASLEPVKVRPEDPGGETTPYQSLRSFEVAAGDRAEPLPTTLATPAQSPTEEDVAMAELAPLPGGDTRPADAPMIMAATSDRDPADPAGADPELILEEEPAAGQATGAPPIPPVRPRDLTAQSERLSQQAIDEAAQLAARAALSPIQIQLGAYTDRAYTESEWRRIANANDDILAGRALAIQSTVSGGKKYWRLRVGPFRDRAEAGGICEALRARGHDCLVAENS